MIPLFGAHVAYPRGDEYVFEFPEGRAREVHSAATMREAELLGKTLGATRVVKATEWERLQVQGPLP